MTPEHKQIVRSTWQQVTPIADQAARMFYDRLFELNPALEPLFADADMDTQRKKLLQSLGFVVNGLDDLEPVVVPVLETLGRSHVDYGVTDKDYDTVGDALLWTLEQGLGPAWTSEAEEAWSEAYTLVSGVMRDAAANPVQVH